MKDICKYSSPQKAIKNLQKYYGTDALYISSRSDKKYMVQDPRGRWIHFGQMGYQDFTKHKDKGRRKLFQQRNHNWQYAHPFTPAHLSWYILW